MAGNGEPAAGAVKVAVFGSGSFGTAMATLVARNGHEVAMLTRRAEVAEGINGAHRNPTHLTQHELLPNITATLSAEECLAGARYVVHCVPLQASEQFLATVRPFIGPDVRFISTSKGLHTETLEMMHEILPRVLGNPEQPMAFFSGPTFAQELMAGMPSGAICASKDLALARECGRLFGSARIKVWPSKDVIGVEVGGALKNVIAILSGVIEGRGFGVNSVAMLVTRGCREINKLAVTMGADPYTMTSLAGIGDLMLTCLGGLSRNKAVGIEIGKGKTLAQILEERQKSLQGVAEGVATTPAAYRLAQKYGMEAPIIESAAKLLSGEFDLKQAMDHVMTYPCYEDAAFDVEEIRRKVSPANGE